MVLELGMGLQSPGALPCVDGQRRAPPRGARAVECRASVQSVADDRCGEPARVCGVDTQLVCASGAREERNARFGRRCRSSTCHAVPPAGRAPGRRPGAGGRRGRGGAAGRSRPRRRRRRRRATRCSACRSRGARTGAAARPRIAILREQEQARGIEIEPVDDRVRRSRVATESFVERARHREQPAGLLTTSRCRPRTGRAARRAAPRRPAAARRCRRAGGRGSARTCRGTPDRARRGGDRRTEAAAPTRTRRARAARRPWRSAYATASAPRSLRRHPAAPPARTARAAETRTSPEGDAGSRASAPRGAPTSRARSSSSVARGPRARRECAMRGVVAACVRHHRRGSPGRARAMGGTGAGGGPPLFAPFRRWRARSSSSSDLLVRDRCCHLGARAAAASTSSSAGGRRAPPRPPARTRRARAGSNAGGTNPGTHPAPVEHPRERREIAAVHHQHAEHLALGSTGSRACRSAAAAAPHRAAARTGSACAGARRNRGRTRVR